MTTETSLKFITTGVPALDAILIGNGWPRGRIVQIAGPIRSGKTALGLRTIAEAQARGGTAAFIDASHSFHVEYATEFGVTVEDLLISQPDSAEQAMEVCESLARSGAVDVIVVDSITDLMSWSGLGGLAAANHRMMMSQALRRLTTAAAQGGAAVVFLIPTRAARMDGQPVGEESPWKDFATILLRTYRSGASARFKILKNTLAPPFGEAEAPFPFLPPKTESPDE